MSNFQEEFPHHAGYENTAAFVRYAVIFASDCEPSTIANAHPDQATTTFAALAIALGHIADDKAGKAREAKEDFYPVAYVEAAAQYFNRYPAATLAQLMEAGQLESDAIAGK